MTNSVMSQVVSRHNIIFKIQIIHPIQKYFSMSGTRSHDSAAEGSRARTAPLGRNGAVVDSSV